MIELADSLVVATHKRGRRVPDWIEITLFYVVSEALSNAAKHACASVVQVKVEEVDPAGIELSIRDDGEGGADPSLSSGLIGIKDRVESFGGQPEIESAAGAGTVLHVEFPDVHRPMEHAGEPDVPRHS